MPTHMSGHIEQGVFDRALPLIEELASSGVHLDFGCGHGPIAEGIVELGLDYCGLDSEGPDLVSLRDRGHQTCAVDLCDTEGLTAAVADAVGTRRISSISAFDVLERLVDPDGFLRALRRIVGSAGAIPLVLAVHNVSHFDVAAKLLYGRWDVTNEGLLSSLEVTHFTERRLSELAGATGWRQAGTNDVVRIRSDQCFPADHIALNARTSVGKFLRQQRGMVDNDGSVAHFVRSYLPANPTHGRAPSVSEAVEAPFATVVLRTQGIRANLIRDALQCLAGQTERDFELLVAGHGLTTGGRASVERTLEEYRPLFDRPIRLLCIEGGERAAPLNAAAQLASGRYLMFLDDDDLVLANWVETFHAMAARHDGNLLRTVAVEQDIEPEKWDGNRTAFRTIGKIKSTFPPDFDLLAHLVINQSPFMSVAFPMAFFRTLGHRFDESLSVVEDWDSILRAALLCGWASEPVVTAVYRKWVSGHSSYTLESAHRWELTERQVVNKLDKMAHVLPPGTIMRLRQQSRDLEDAQFRQKELEREIRRLRGQLRKLQNSRSWRVMAPVRQISKLRTPGNGRAAGDVGKRRR